MSLLSPQLEAFLAVVKYKTVHAAADTIHLTQTAVTQRIRSLEKKLSTTLFARTRKGMLLTPEGEAMLRYCNAVRELAGETLAKIQGGGITTEIQLSISGPSSMMQARVIPQCLKVMEQFPNLLMYFNVTDIEMRDKLLRAGECDLAIVQKEHVANEMEAKILQPEEYVLVCTASWKNRTLTDIVTHERIIDYDPNDQMTFNYLKHFRLFDKARLERHFVNRTELLALMLAAGHGYGVLTNEFSEPYIRNKQLIILNEGRTYKNTIALAWYPRPEFPKYFSALIEAIN